ncbi:uncharacterized protein BO97DRAFT_425396 [Aspergillus homomorphus CBS 101889]|uniref:Uncharacterized protein n=1 Tax=Aspergillus homomorphus (strain CBS 101889) TaxID=1450537 RepID=A0A395HW36_ASPHC|nr:hypothetical protein BO97DRAFT_425396 [Aspergillus homomorphus CBS 101889]RAL11739.1 hypothetical protein BO97DRAFT_425396 [Aspergillus homomorphus CBS 101889]
MPRRHRPQPSTPPDLPPIPEGAYKQDYYLAPDTVYYVMDKDSIDWRRGTISEMTRSTVEHLVVDEETQEIVYVLVQYIRRRAEWD